MILSCRSHTGDCSARFGTGIGIGLGLDFPNFTLLEQFEEISYRISHRDRQAMGFAEVSHSIGQYPRIPFSSLLDGDHHHRVTHGCLRTTTNSEFTIAPMWPESTREFPHTAPSVGSL
jgi:hypothetical protein